MYKERLIEEVSHLINEKTILLLTATDLETKCLHESLIPLGQEEFILQVYIAKQTVYFGQLGSYLVVHAQCGMGTSGYSSSIITLMSLLNKFKSKLVLMVGIAFGIKGKIGDVLVSESIIPYESRRVGDVNIQRGIESKAGTIILNRIKNVRDWIFELEYGGNSELKVGSVLSGEELIDNLERRKELEGEFPKAIGGEMEGAGVASVCDGNTEWVLIKGICDFADGNKGENKDGNQIIAFSAAIDFCEKLLLSKTALLELGISPFEEKNSLFVFDKNKTRKALFNNYRLEYEGFYLNRKIDDLINKMISKSNLWLYGACGRGKSNAILRSLIQSNQEHLYITLTSATGKSVDEIILELFYSLYKKLKGEDPVGDQSFSNGLEKIISFLKQENFNEEIVVFIDEIPIDGSNSEAFSKKLFAFIIEKELTSDLDNIRFVLSSIEDPTKNIPEQMKKIHEFMNFEEIDSWEKGEINQLIKLIESGLGWELNKESKERIVAESDNSPRFIKNVYNGVCMREDNSNETVNRLIVEAKNLLN